MANKRADTTKDINQIAAELLEEAVGKPPPITSAGKKNPAAAGARRAGGAKRSAAGAKGLSPKKRTT